MKEELAEIIGFETSDPRLLPVTVTDVHVSPDSRHARVTVAVRGEPTEEKQALAALEHAKHFLRHELAVRLSLRHVPELHFEIDRTDGSEDRIEILLKRAKKIRARDEEKQP